MGKQWVGIRGLRDLGKLDRGGLALEDVRQTHKNMGIFSSEGLLGPVFDPLF